MTNNHQHQEGVICLLDYNDENKPAVCIKTSPQLKEYVAPQASSTPSFIKRVQGIITNFFTLGPKEAPPHRISPIQPTTNFILNDYDTGKPAYISKAPELKPYVESDHSTPLTPPVTPLQSGPKLQAYQK